MVRLSHPDRPVMEKRQTHGDQSNPTWPIISKEITLEPIICIQCGTEFDLSGTNRDKLTMRGFDLPKRCPDCRKKKSKYLVDENPIRRRDKKKHYHQKYDQN